jgi:hypothetical protein
MTSTEDEIMCDSCGFENPVHGVKSFKSSPMHQEEIRNLCEICANSFVGNATEHRNQYENVALFEVVAVIGNIIRKDLKELQR